MMMRDDGSNKWDIRIDSYRISGTYVVMIEFQEEERVFIRSWGQERWLVTHIVLGTVQASNFKL